MCALLREEVVAEKSAEGYEGGEIKSSTINHFVCLQSQDDPSQLLHVGEKLKSNSLLETRGRSQLISCYTVWSRTTESRYLVRIQGCRFTTKNIVKEIVINPANQNQNIYF